MYPIRASCTRVAGTLASNVPEADRTGVPSAAHYGLGIITEVVGRNRVRWSAGQLSNESALSRTTNSTPLKKLDRLDVGSWMDELTPICHMKYLPLGSSTTYRRESLELPHSVLTGDINAHSSLTLVH